MTERSEPPRVNADAVGKDRPSPDGSGGAANNWFKFGALTWSIVIVLAAVFAIAIIVAAM